MVISDRAVISARRASAVKSARTETHQAELWGSAFPGRRWERGRWYL